MSYDNIPGIGVTYLDGAFKEPRTSTQGRALVLGTASSGLSNELFTVSSVRLAENEFGSDSELLQGVHEILAQGSDNIAVMRIGGQVGSLVVEDSDGDTLTVVTEYRDAEILERYSLAISNDGVTNRIGIYDVIDETWVYDSEEILVLNVAIIEVVDTGLALTTVGDFSFPEDNPLLADLTTPDFTMAGSETISTITLTSGTDGENISLVERYAALNTAYHLLDYRDADYIHSKGVYVDSKNVIDDGAVANFWKGVPSAGSTTDELGYVWEYIYRGKIYTYFTDSKTYFSVSKTAATRTVLTDLVITAAVAGVGGNDISIEVIVGGSTVTAVITEPDDEKLKITVTGPSGGTTTQARNAINAALAAYTTDSGLAGSDLVVATGGGATTLTTLAEVFLTSGAGGAALTHAALTGDVVPAAVSSRFAAGEDSELREVNFAHQIASFCYLASSSWKTLIGAISFKAPAGQSRAQWADWAGELPDYTDDGTQKYIDAPGDNGSGILGNKFLAGLSKSSAGYRSALVTGGNSTDGYAYGGFILTRGTALPNGTPYGISDSDEALDANAKPIDIGKHIIVTYPWVIHRNAWNGGTAYRGGVAGTVLGRVIVAPSNEEPIGVNGIVRQVTSVPKIHATQLDGLASIRAIGLKFAEGLGYVIVSLKTAAHPDSDYTQVSTIRTVNEHLDGLRAISKKYLGKSYDPRRIAALQAEIDGYCAAQRGAGKNQGAYASISYDRGQRILGRMKLKLRLVPPFSIQHIDVEVGLAADESEL